MHSPRQVEKGLVCSDSIHSPLGNHLRFKRRKEVGKPTDERQVVRDNAFSKCTQLFILIWYYNANHLLQEAMNDFYGSIATSY